MAKDDPETARTALGERESLGALVERASRPRLLGAMLGRLVEAPVLGPVALRALQLPLGVPAVSTRVTRLHAHLLRRSGGVRRSWLFAAGQPVLSLTTTGRRSGLPRTTAVACFRHGDELATAAMNLGGGRDPSWARNLVADPRATIELAGRRIDVIAERATEELHDELWHRWLGLQPSAGALRARAGREIPLFVLRRAPDSR